MILDVKTLPIVSIVAISSGYFVGSLTYNKLEPQQVQWETLVKNDIFFGHAELQIFDNGLRPQRFRQ